MKTKILTIGLAASLIGASAQEIHNQTTPPPNATFEIVQSQLAVKFTFRLNRFTGQVSQLVKTDKGGNAWDNTRVIDSSVTAASTHPHFQIFLSGLAAKCSFLIDTDTGQTWTLTKLTDDTSNEVETVWEPFEDDDVLDNISATNVPNAVFTPPPLSSLETNSSTSAGAFLDTARATNAPPFDPSKPYTIASTNPFDRFDTNRPVLDFQPLTNSPQRNP